MGYVLDLCSGTGNFSRAFVVHPHFTVIRIEIDPQYAKIPHTQIKNVLQWMDWIEDLPPIDIVLASPVCTEYSLARGAKKVDPDLSLWRACEAIIEYLNPSWYMIENVRGAIAYHGEAKQSIGPFYFWGDFPYLPIHVEYKGKAWLPHSHATPKTRGDGRWCFSYLHSYEEYNKWDTENNAAIPGIISQAIAHEMSSLVTLEDWV